MKDSYRKTIQELVGQLHTNLTKGLSPQEATQRLQQYGPNRMPEPVRRNLFTIIFDQFKNPLIYVLIIAAGLIFVFADQPLDAFIILGVLTFNTIIGTVQEYRTYNIVKSLKRFFKTKSIVLRNGVREVIDNTELVPGDVVILQEGDQVPADGRLCEVHNLTINKAMLTGESKPVNATIEPIDRQATIGDRTNMAFKGTFVTAGNGTMLVTATGKDTEIGKIQQLVETGLEEVPLKKQLRRLSYWLLIFIFIACILLLIIGLWLGRPADELTIMIAALFICVIPEGLPVVLTLTLVTGAYQMAQQKVLARHLQGVEGLGRTDVIIIDKTGTLTRNELMVNQLWSDGAWYTVTGEGYFTEGTILQDKHPVAPLPPLLTQLGVACALLPVSKIFYDKRLKLFEIKGDPTEAALSVLAEKMGFTERELAPQYQELHRIPFDAELQYQAAFYQHKGEVYAFVIGSPEAIISRSTQSNASTALEKLVESGLRVLAVARKKITVDATQWDKNKWKAEEKELLKSELALLGLCGMEDAIRAEVDQIIARARDAGLQVIMATGDHKETALNIAKQVGIFKDGDTVIEGVEFDQLSDTQLLKKLPTITVFARVTPEDKVRIVDLFHQQGNIVAMTGDGVNDAPSLVRADLGIAMGSIGTEVAKQASDLVLLDDSFASIINAIELGRHVAYTLRRVTLYFFSTNLAELLIVFFALLSNLPLPFTAAQILWLNFVTDGFLDVGLSMEPQEEGLLKATWLKYRKNLVDWQLFGITLWMATPMAIGALLMFGYTYAKSDDLLYARTMGLITLSIFQWFNAWNCRSERESITRLGFFANRWFLLAVVFVFFLQLLLVYAPFMQYIFQTVSLAFSDWVMIFVITAPIILWDELRKWGANFLRSNV